MPERDRALTDESSKDDLTVVAPTTCNNSYSLVDVFLN